MTTYWNNGGKHEALYETLRTLIPREGECPNDQPKLEQLRVACNCYYDLYNNGLYNRAAEFRKVFGFGGTKFAKTGFNDCEFEAKLEARMDEIIEAARDEQFPNDKHRVLAFEVNSTCKVEVYLVNPGDFFVGFGGSRHSLVPKRTASLIVREIGVMTVDTEYDVNDVGAWRRIMVAYDLSKAPRPLGEILKPGENVHSLS